VIGVRGRAAVEEGERGDDRGAAAPAREVATAPRRTGVPGELLSRSNLVLSHVGHIYETVGCGVACC
jgi:hypothetical protein